jgi:hypothetical protein
MKQKKYKRLTTKTPVAAEPSASYISQNSSAEVQSISTNMDNREKYMTVEEYISMVRTALEKRYENL